MGPEACTVLDELTARLGTAARLNVVPSATPRAFCAGFWRPGVYLSTGLLALLGEQELQAVVRHEEHHVARRDPLRMAVAQTLAGALFYVPVLRDLEAHFLAAKEVEADRTVVAVMGCRDALAGALLALVGQKAPQPAGVAGFDTVAIRIDALASGAYPPLHLSPLRMGLTALAVLTGTSAGAWLTTNSQLVLLGATMYFVVCIVGAAWLLGGRAALTLADRSAEIPGANDCCAPVLGGLHVSRAKPDHLVKP